MIPTFSARLALPNEIANQLLPDAAFVLSFWH
jgi:hypothetical protein